MHDDAGSVNMFWSQVNDQVAKAVEVKGEAHRRCGVCSQTGGVPRKELGVPTFRHVSLFRFRRFDMFRCSVFDVSTWFAVWIEHFATPLFHPCAPGAPTPLGRRAGA